MEGIYTIIGVLIGSAITIFVSYKDRKTRKDIISLEINHKKKLFEIEINQKQELFKLERKDKFRLTAIEKRLDAHQKALNHWHYLQNILFEENIEKQNTVIQNAINFWLLHSIYLEKETRKRFFEVVNIVQHYETNLQILKNIEDKTEKDEFRKQIKEDFSKIKTLPDYIFKEVELEPIIFNDMNNDPFGNDKTENKSV